MKRVLMAAAMFSAISTAATAQDTGQKEAPKPVTRTALSAELDADYADMDSDKDGKVTPAEINTRLVKSAEAKLEVIRKERDAAFAKLDANSDGSISKAEFDEKAKLPTIKEPDAKPFLDRFDTNKDGAISKDEFRAPTLANFDKTDKNKDGTVTPAERSSAPAATSSTAKKPTFKKTPAINR